MRAASTADAQAVQGYRHRGKLSREQKAAFLPVFAAEAGRSAMSKRGSVIQVVAAAVVHAAAHAPHATHSTHAAHPGRATAAGGLQLLLRLPGYHRLGG